jgi:hypothetical protein
MFAKAELPFPLIRSARACELLPNKNKNKRKEEERKRGREEEKEDPNQGESIRK